MQTGQRLDAVSYSKPVARHGLPRPHKMTTGHKDFMKRTLGTILLFWAAGLSQAQTPSSSPAQAPSAQSPSSQAPNKGAASSPAGTPSQAGSPVVIRNDAGQLVENAPADSRANGSDGTNSRTTGADGKSIVGSNLNAPAAAPNGFQQFVREALGHDLPVFGSFLFGSGAFTPSSGVAPPADYVLGTGDQLIIRAWGKIDIDVSPTVDRNGQIFVPRIGMLTVAGLRLDRLTEFIHNAISQQFTGFELSVSLGDLRSIQIFVLGNARSPGVHTISSLSTLVNAVFTSGGPSSTGTLRDIQLMRGGQVVSHFDVYKLLLSGDKSADTRLLSGDIIFIPRQGAQVAIDGDVGTPAIYEIRTGDTIGTVLNEAGGLTPIAGTSRAILEHVIEHSRRSIEELALDDKGLAIKLEPADILRVFPISSKITGVVTLRGNVTGPGRYVWRLGMRITDVIPNRDFLLTRAYFDRLNAMGSSFGNETPAAATHDTEINWNYAVIERLDHSDLTTRLVSFKLGEALDNPASPENKELNADDVVVVYSQSDVALPAELQAKFVRIDGQVKAPGVYRVRQDQTLRELVEQAGGLVSHSYLYAAQLSRESVRAQQAARIRDFVARESQEILAPSNQRTSIGGASDIGLRQAYIAQLSALQPDGRVLLRMPVNADKVADVPPIPLEDGDHFFVPAVPTTVDVLGAVYNPSALSFSTGARASSYLNLAGGATRAADRKREFIIRANGTLVSRQNVSDFGRAQLFPGDALVVPSKFKTGFSPADILSLSQVLSTFALGAVAIEAVR